MALLFLQWVASHYGNDRAYFYLFKLQAKPEIVSFAQPQRNGWEYSCFCRIIYLQSRTKEIDDLLKCLTYRILV